MKRSITHLSTFVLALVALVLLIGCSPWATYPKIEGAAQVGNPQFEPLPSIMATAIRQGHERAGFEGEPVYNLPEGTGRAGYAAVQAQLGQGRAMQEPGEPAVHVIQVRVRGVDAEVDVILPRRDAPPEMVTYRMRQRFLHHYRVTDTRRWNIAVDVPEPTSPQSRAQEAVDEQAEELPDENG